MLTLLGILVKAVQLHCNINKSGYVGVPHFIYFSAFKNSRSGVVSFWGFFGLLFLFSSIIERTQMFVTSRLLEMGFSMRHIYWAMEAAGTALWSMYH